MKVKELLTWLNKQDKEANIMIRDFDIKNMEYGNWNELEEERILVRKDIPME